MRIPGIRLRGLALAIGLAVAIALLAGCASEEPAGLQRRMDARRQSVPIPTAIPPTEAPVAAPTATTAPPTRAPTPVPATAKSADNCITCHTEQAVLEKMAVDKTVASAETEGEG